jgi:hypothetical protein
MREERRAALPLTVGFTHKYHAHPRLSASQISEYISANSSNRKRILREAKYPPTMLLIRYDDARSAVVEHMTGNGASRDTLNNAVLALNRKIEADGMTDYKKQNCRLSSEAIEAFQAGEGKLGLSAIKFKAPNIHNTKLKLGGVTLSVSLDLMTEKTASDGGKIIGGVVLVFSKSGGAKKNMPERCQAIALLAHEVIKHHLKPGETSDPKMCMAVDIFSGKVYRAKSQQKTLYKNVEASCEEAATMWPTVKPPANYNGPPIPKV